MANMLVCTGKKRAVKKVLEYFKEIEGKKGIQILAHVQRTKKAMIWSYEELKVLFTRKGGNKPLEIDQKLVRQVDFLQLRHPRGVLVKMSSPLSEDKDLRYNILSRTSSFQLRGGHVEIREVVNKESRRESRTCAITLSGNCGNVMILKDLLVKEKFVDPNSVEFIL